VIGTVGGCAAAATLLAAGAGHLRSPGTLPAALRAHGLLPAPALVAAAVTAAETGLGGAAAVGLLGGPGRPAALAGCAVLLALLAAYAAWVVLSGRGGPCGCTRAGLPMTGWVAARAAGLAGLAAAGAASAGPTASPAAELTVALLAAAALSGLLWQLPAAMHDPATPGGVR
jgi:hypothetical protein